MKIETGKSTNPFGELIGLTYTKWEEGYSQCRIEVKDHLMNPHLTLHGAVVYAMADTGMGMTLYTVMDEQELCSTVEIKIGYIGAVRTGELLCDTRLIHRGRKIAFLESEIRNPVDDQESRLIAKASGTFYIFDKKSKENF